MRINQMSDLHLEFNHKFRPINNSNADLLMLNGDICVADYFTKSKDSPKFHIAEHFLDFFRVASEQYENVIYVMGNHEHYHGVFTETVNIIKHELYRYDNIHVLDNECVDIGGYRIIGATLWTNCDNSNPLVESYLSGYMNDFKIVKYSKEPYIRFLPAMSVVEHRKSLDYIKQKSKTSDKVIVATHHAPSSKSIHGSYRSEQYFISNFGYFTELDEFILDNPQIKLWTHGHVHNNFYYSIGETVVACNPHGYGMENVHGFDRTIVLDL